MGLGQLDLMPGNHDEKGKEIIVFNQKMSVPRLAEPLAKFYPLLSPH